MVAWLAADRSRRWWMLWLFVAALAVRLHWNLEVHPLNEYLYSDMRGYATRADQLLDEPFKAYEYAAFFPFGTSWFIAAIKWVFGRDNWTAIGSMYALIGALIVPMCYAIADRTMGERVRWVAPAVGVLLIFYFPLIGIGGYSLSELPFAFCLTCALWLLIRLVDEGKALDAWMLGITLGLGTTVRSQMLASIGLIGLLWFFTRVWPLPWTARGKSAARIWPKLTWGKMIQVAIPLALILAGSAIRFNIHTGRHGIVSENGAINFVFGRCHNKGIHSRPDGKGHGTVRFAPPPLIQLEHHSADHPDHLIQLDPFFGDHPEPPPNIPGFKVDALGCKKRGCLVAGSEIEYQGYIGDQKLQREIAMHCVREGGLQRQAYYSFVHVVQLWKYAQMWPDQANPRPRPKNKDESWRALQDNWATIHRVVLLVPALLGLLFAFVPGRRPKEALVAVNLWALLIIAAIWIGGIRFRVPYDPVIVLLAGFGYGFAWEQGRKLVARVKARRQAGAPEGS